MGRWDITGTKMMEQIKTEVVLAAIANTKRSLPEYWQKTLEQRTSNGKGSRYTIESPELIELMLMESTWFDCTERVSDLIMEGCKCYATQLPGILGIVSLDDLDQNQKLRVIDPKGTGKFSLEVEGNCYKTEDVTYLIVGKEGDVDVVYTFHPGLPIKLGTFSMEGLYPGKTLTVTEAKQIGFKNAKIA